MKRTDKVVKLRKNSAIGKRIIAVNEKIAAIIMDIINGETIQNILKKKEERDVGHYIRFKGGYKEIYLVIFYIVITEIKKNEPLWSIMSMLEFKTYKKENRVKKLA